ncbi:MAG: MarR family transcriptional regulator [Firmicutes bacterium]|nr:MarR family transcriptional regulator [Bacillota bacterium]
MAGAAHRARELLIEALGRQSAFWGLGKAPGEIYAVLYLAGRPLSLTEVAEALGVTKGAVSLAVRPLEQLGMVRRSWRRADRRVYFEAETDFWRIGLAVLSRRQRPEFEASFRLVEEAEAALAAAAGDAAADAEPGDPEAAEAAHALRRVRALRDFYRALDDVVDALVRLQPRELERFAAALADLARAAAGDGKGGVGR